MMFVSYTPLDAIGTEVGLMLLTKMVDSIWHGNFFGVTILSIVVFLSLAKIAIDGIIEHKYETALFEFARLAIVAALFAVTGSATIFSMNIINFGYAYEAAQNGNTTLGNILNFAGKEINKFTGDNITGYTYNISNPTSASIQANGVPLMAEIYAIPSDLAYQISSIMLNPQQNTTIDVANMILDPKDLILTAWNSMIKASNNPGAIYRAFAKCYDQTAYNSIQNSLQGNGMSCDQFNQMWAQSAQNIVDQIKQQGNVDPTVFKADENIINLIKQGTLQNDSSLKSEYLGDVLARMDKAAQSSEQLEGTLGTTQGTQPSTSLSNRLANNVQQTTGKAMTTITLVLSTALSLKDLLEDMMITIQEYAIAAMFILLPLVVVVGLLPIFGNNYKLILKYAFSFFLIKLWIPLYWFIYVAMVNISAILMSSASPIHDSIHFIHYGIQYAITTFVGHSAYAQTPIISSTHGFPSSISEQQIVSTANAMEAAAVANKFSAFNNIILSFFAFAIPSVLGSSATYLVGRGMVEAGATAAAESVLLTKKLFFAAGRMATQVAAKGFKTGVSMAWNAAKAAPGAIKAAPGAIKNAPDTIRNLWKDRQITKKLYDEVSVGRSAKALGVKMKRSTREEIARATTNRNGFVQDKEGGVIAFYDKNYKLRGIMKKDGTMVNANSLSAEERAKYDFDIERSFGVINTETGDFVSARFNRQAEITPNYTEDRIGKIKNKEMLEKLNKMLK